MNRQRRDYNGTECRRVFIIDLTVLTVAFFSSDCCRDEYFMSSQILDRVMQIIRARKGTKSCVFKTSRKYVKVKSH